MAEEEGQVGGGKHRPIQKVKLQPNGWTKARRARFLKVLAESCNVKMAARAAGVTVGPYHLRARDPVFAQLWDQALAIGYDRLEAALLQRALEGVNAIDVTALADESDREAAAGDAPGGEGTAPGRRGHHRPGSGVPRDGLARTDVQLALALLNRRREGEVRQRRGRQPMTSDEVDAVLLRKLDGLVRKSRDPA